MLTLLAYTADERRAYVREGDVTFLLLPPYVHDVALLDGDSDVERAVTVHGYTASDRSFATRRELLDFLADESVRVRREHNPPIHIDVLRKRLRDVLATDDIDRHIARTQEKIDAGAVPEALAMLGLLGSATALSPGQRRRIDEMVARATEAERARSSAALSAAREDAEQDARLLGQIITGPSRIFDAVDLDRTNRTFEIRLARLLASTEKEWRLSLENTIASHAAYAAMSRVNDAR